MPKETRHTNDRANSSDGSDLLFGDSENTINNPLAQLLSNLGYEELFTAAGFIAYEKGERYISSNHQYLIDYIVSNSNNEYLQESSIRNAKEICSRLPKTNFPWIPESPSKRFTAFIDFELDYQVIKTDSGDSRLPIIFAIRLLWRCNPNWLEELERIEKNWELVQPLTIKNRNIVFEDFSKHFKNSFFKTASAVNTHHSRSSTPYHLIKKHIKNYPLCDLDDCTIWLDMFSIDKLHRDHITKSALKNYRQALRRSSNNRSQLNIEIPQKQRKNLEKLCEKYGFSQSEIISILLEYEVSENHYLNRHQARLNEHVRIIQGSKTS